MRIFKVVIVSVFILLTAASILSAQTPLPRFTIGVDEARTPQEVSVSLQILLLLTILSLAPSILIMLTSFIRVYIVLAFIPRALTTQNIPPNQVLIGLALFITLYIMWPIFTKSYNEGIKPYIDGKMNIEKAFENTMKPIREFMFKQTNEKYIYQFIKIANLPRPATRDDVPTYVLIPAFIVNELTVSFYMGAILLIPFLIIDIVVSSILISMGMFFLPPVVISFPLKIIFFFLIDGWALTINKLVLSFF
ncbi:MAG: flagellar type III secretion system pore protein FliP [Brevinematales bacterium]|nr:flagellar type III secretion system pore protein FliP [Brevinematales bacterium]